MNISLDQAKAFRAVVEFGGYTKAATALNKNHSSLVYLIKSMEDQCGFDLFDRRGYRNTLTARGQTVYSKCLEILAKVEELDLLCGHFSEGWEPSLKIVFDGILPFDPFLGLYKKFQSEKIPTVVQTYTDYLEDVEETFNHISADLMISIIPVEKQGLKSFYLKPFNSYLVAHKDHPIHQKKQRWTAQELMSFSFLTIRGSGKKLGLNTDEFEKSASFFFSDFSIKKEALLKKTGFGWLPQHLIEKELKSRMLIPVKWERESIQRVQPILYIKNNAKSGLATHLIVDWFNSNFGV